MEQPLKKKRIRFYRSFEEQSIDEAGMAAQRSIPQRLQDTVALIMRVYGVPSDARMKRVITFR